LKFKTNIEEQYLKKAKTYLVLSFLFILLFNVLILIFHNHILSEPPMQSLYFFGLFVSIFFYTTTFITIIFSLKRTHLELFINTRNDSLTYLMLPLLCILYIFKKNIFGPNYIFLSFILLICIIKFIIFINIFFTRRFYKLKTEFGPYTVLLTVLILSYLSVKGIELNTRLREIKLPPAGFTLSSSKPIFTLTPEKPIDADSIKIISYLASAPNVPQDALVGYIHIFGDKKEHFTFNLRAGIETSELGFGFQAVAPNIKHKQANIYKSRLSNIAGVDYIQSFEYKQRYDFEKPINIKSIKFEFAYVTDKPELVRLVITKLFYYRYKRTH
jgi:hypothetical protein